ncbi:hypothetical protein [Saccharothrix stipae]
MTPSGRCDRWSGYAGLKDAIIAISGRGRRGGLGGQSFMGYRFAIFNHATAALGGAVTVNRFSLTTP